MNTSHPPAALAFGRSRPLKPVASTLVCALFLSLSATAQTQTPDIPAAPPEPVLNSTLNAPLFYQLLLGELNVNQGEPGTGYSLILDAARKQRDGKLYRRAVEVALQARSGDAALTAAQAWAQALPDDMDAQRFVQQILLALNRVPETTAVQRTLIERAKPTERDDVINAIPQTYARVADKALALRVVREALASTLRQREHAAAAWTTLGRMELASDDVPQAMASAQAGHTADPSSPYPALLALSLMERGQTSAEAWVTAHLAAQPAGAARGPNVALAYARVLLDLQRIADARAQLERLTTQQPQLAEPWLLLGVLHMQDSAWPAANAALNTYLKVAGQPDDEREARELSQAYLHLAQIAEKQKDFAAASAWLDRIDNADTLMAVQLRRASLLAQRGQMAQARALLREQPERRPEDARLKLVYEAQLLREFKAWQQAFDVYAEGVARFPEDADFLYDQSSMAEKLGRFDTMEQVLRRLIALKPDHQHAYNALGYSLADRGVRLPEAKQLIEKAVALAPDDANIRDSLGWVEFRLGNHARALTLLQKAYSAGPNAEIAAHLGEVLWITGQRDQAMKIWREGLLQASDNETLLSTLKRLRVKP